MRARFRGSSTFPVDHMTALPMFAERFREIAAGRDAVVVAPATTRAKQGSWLAEMLQAELAIMNDDPEVGGRGMTILGEVEGKIALVLENGIGSGQWFVRAAEELDAMGAASVYACATHAASTAGAADRLARSPLAGILVTDTVPIHESLESARFEVLSVAGLLAETIANVFANESVSAIFVGDSQLF